MAAVLPQDIVDFLGLGGASDSVAQAGEHLTVITSMVKAYTRGQGFDLDGDPNDEIAAVITTATARLMANPEQIAYDSGSTSVRGGFNGFSLAETFVLNRYRKRAV